MRSLTLSVRFHTKGGHERQANVSTQHASPQAYAWISSENGDEKRAPGAQTPPRERAEAADRLERITPIRTGPWPDFVPPNAFAGEQSFSRCMSEGPRFTVA